MLNYLLGISQINQIACWTPAATAYKEDFSSGNYLPGKTASFEIDKKKGIMKIKLLGQNKGVLNVVSYRLSKGDDLTKMTIGDKTPITTDIFSDRYTTLFRFAVVEKLLNMLTTQNGIMEYGAIDETMHKEIYDASAKGRPPFKQNSKKDKIDYASLPYPEWFDKAGIYPYREMAFGENNKEKKEVKENYARMVVAFDELAMEALEIDLSKLNVEGDKKPNVLEVELNTNLMTSRSIIAQSPPFSYDGKTFKLLSTTKITQTGWFLPLIFFVVASVLLVLSIIFIKKDKKESVEKKNN